MAEKRRSRRKNWAYGELTVGDVVASALRLVERDGIAKLTTRRLADELGMSAMVAHYYVGNKESLLDLVMDEIVAAIDVPTPDAGDWKVRLRGFLDSTREQLLRYRGVAQLVQTRPLGPNGMQVADGLAALLHDAGFTPRVAEQVAFSTTYYVLGVVAWEAGLDLASDSALHRSADGTGPTVAVRQARYEFGIDLLFRGIDDLLREQGGGPARRPRRRARARAAS